MITGAVILILMGALFGAVMMRDWDIHHPEALARRRRR